MEQAVKDAVALAYTLGAYKAAVIPVSAIVLDESFRQLCAANSCGRYGRCWMCPPDVGEIGPLMARVRGFGRALVYQTVGQLEDSYDIEGMQQAGKVHNDLVQQLKVRLSEGPFAGALHLGAGSCQVCERCAKADGLPCRFPQKAIPSLEAHGIHVSKLAEACGMRYINGQNTVTYFGAVLFGAPDGAEGAE